MNKRRRRIRRQRRKMPGGQCLRSGCNRVFERGQAVHTREECLRAAGVWGPGIWGYLDRQGLYAGDQTRRHHRWPADEAALRHIWLLERTEDHEGSNVTPILWTLAEKAGVDLSDWDKPYDRGDR